MLAIAACLMIAIISPTPASADSFPFSQNFGDGTEHSSHDFVPSSNQIHLGGSGCKGGNAHYFYLQLVTTSGSNEIFPTHSYPADGTYYEDPRGITVSTSTSYYIRWYGQDEDLNRPPFVNPSAPCATVKAH
ncbi:MAG: hypothetical protein M3Y48_16180 [Actinomycetota bacterium]|nr:hypothetical protein [Actinomycetota bacterium]